MINLLERNIIDIANRNGCQHIVKVISTNQMGLYLYPFTSISSIGILLTPTELEEGSTRYNLTSN